MATHSPFPGMDPYLEQHWGDVHHALITYARDALNECLPTGLRARMEERVYLETGDQIRTRVPDVRIVEQPRATGAQARSNGGAMVAEPLIVSLPDDPVTETLIQILDIRTGNRVVTVIEILSPGNKSGGIGQRMYVQKQEEIFASRASLVEIDLLREGNRVILCPPENIPPSHRTPYQICVHRGWKGLQFEIYAVPLREPLPAIYIPLREADTDVVLELQPLLERAYANGGYEDIAYAAEPSPPLIGDDKRWADELLRAAGKR